MASKDQKEVKKWRIASLTYNVNNRRSNRKEIQTWLENENLDPSANVLVSIALQEVSYLDIGRETWNEILNEEMNNRGFTAISTSYLASNLMLIYSPWRVLNIISKVNQWWTRNSALGLLGYKGTISVQIVLRSNTKIVFMTSHFASGVENVQNRIKQYHQSMDCKFICQSERNIIIWMGDFNSRLDLDEDFDEITSKLKINSSRIDLLESCDQIKKSAKRKEAFHEFKEAEINFMPTYRILVGSDKFDPQRIPAWCDRILYAGSEQANLKPLRYSSFRGIKLSDHFPVSADFEFEALEELSEVHQVINKLPLTRWTCIFEQIPTWEVYIPFMCRITVPTNYWKTEGSNRDWVGLYPEALVSLEKPIDWVYLLSCPYDDDMKIFVEFDSLKAGRYRLCYFSYRNNYIRGISNAFSVREVPLDR